MERTRNDTPQEAMTFDLGRYRQKPCRPMPPAPETDDGQLRSNPEEAAGAPDT